MRRGRECRVVSRRRTCTKCECVRKVKECGVVRTSTGCECVRRVRECGVGRQVDSIVVLQLCGDKGEQTLSDTGETQVEAFTTSSYVKMMFNDFCSLYFVIQKPIGIKCYQI